VNHEEHAGGCEKRRRPLRDAAEGCGEAGGRSLSPSLSPAPVEAAAKQLAAAAPRVSPTETNS